MSTPAPPYTWTYSEYARFPDDGNRYEVIHGEVLVTPAPTPHHQRVALRVARTLDEYVERHGLGTVLMDVDVLFATGHFLRPDLVWIPADRREGISDRGIEVPPGLVVEVQSPTSRTIDCVKKPRRYGEFGIPEYWVLDPIAGEALLWRFAAGDVEPAPVTGRFEWRPADAPEPLVLDTAELFRPL